MTAISGELSGDFGEIEEIFIDSSDCGDFYGGCNVFNVSIASWSEISITEIADFLRFNHRNRLLIFI